jgi:hypothetical protein
MSEVSAPQAAEILNTSHVTIFRRVDDGSLPARREGLKQTIWIEIDTLRLYAKVHGYRFSEELAAQYAK